VTGAVKLVLSALLSPVEALLKELTPILDKIERLGRYVIEKRPSYDNGQ
jgi:hypothetical protein